MAVVPKAKVRQKESRLGQAESEGKTMMLGTINNLTDRGFGFVQPEGTTERQHRHFFHAKHLSNVQFESLKPGLPVEFESVNGERGLEAHNVQVKE